MYVSHNASPESSTPSKLMIKLQGSHGNSSHKGTERCWCFTSISMAKWTPDLAHLIPRLDPMGGIVMTNDGNAILREAVPKSTDTTCMLENGWFLLFCESERGVLFWRRETKEDLKLRTCPVW